MQNLRTQQSDERCGDHDQNDAERNVAAKISADLVPMIARDRFGAARPKRGQERSINEKDAGENHARDVLGNNVRPAQRLRHHNVIDFERDCGEHGEEPMPASAVKDEFDVTPDCFESLARDRRQQCRGRDQH